MIDSLRHVNDPIAISAITGLAAALNSFVALSQVTALLDERTRLPISGQTATDFAHLFTEAALVRELVLVLQSDEPGTITVRQNDDEDTDFDIVLQPVSPHVHLLHMPVFDGAKIALIGVPEDTLLNYTFYLA